MKYKDFLIIKNKIKDGTVIKIHHIVYYDWIANKLTSTVLDKHSTEQLSSAFIFASK